MLIYLCYFYIKIKISISFICIIYRCLGDAPAEDIFDLDLGSYTDSEDDEKGEDLFLVKVTTTTTYLNYSD